MQGVWVGSLIEELRSHMSHGQNTKTENRNNIVTNLVKTLKWSTSKKILKRKKTTVFKKKKGIKVEWNATVASVKKTIIGVRKGGLETREGAGQSPG